MTGIGLVDQDEFMLNLLNEQNIWNSVTLATPDPVSTKKLFLSRTARYSGLLNILNFSKTDLSDAEQLTSLLDGANSWIAFNVSRTDIERFSQAAISSNIKRLVITTSLSASNINETNIPEFERSIDAFKNAGASFTGFRHGDIIPGDEDHPYEIVNSTVSCLGPVIERGVLARVVAEAISIEKSYNKEFGVGSSGQFAAAYLNVLRSSGLTRAQEVEKIIAGGLQRVARLTVSEYERRKKKEEEAEAAAEKIKADLLAEAEKELALARARAAKALEEEPSLDSVRIDIDEGEELINPDNEDDFEETYEQIIANKTEAILKSVFAAYYARMYTKSTSKQVFFETNREKARGLAIKEYEEELAKAKAEEAESKSRADIMNVYNDANRQQYSKLLSLERKEMLNQKAVSDVWVKYIYLLLEETMASCKESDILFYNMDEYAQTLYLRKIANKLRQEVGIPPFEVIYDHLDAAAIVGKLSDTDIGRRAGIHLPAEELVESLENKYGKLLKSVSALRGAQQIIDMAISTLKEEIPNAPMSVSGYKAFESSAKRDKLSKSRLESIKKRGQPAAEEELVVGKL